MQLNFLFDNLTIFSVLKVIFIHRSYRVIHLFTAATELDNDFSTEITTLSHQYLLPIRLITFDQIPTIVRSKCEEPILNVVLMNDVEELNQLNQQLRPNEVNLILLTATETTENEVDFQPLINFDKKLLIMSNRFIASIDQHRFDQIHLIPLQPFDQKSTKDFIFDIFSAGKAKMNGKNINIFMQHLPPKSSVSATDSGRVIFNGPDGILSELLVKSLEAKPIFWSDIGIMYPEYDQWKNDPMVAPRLHYRNYHKEALTRNYISSVNRTADDANIYLHMSSYMVDPDYIDNSLNWTTDKLYPHGKDCLVIIVPRQYQVGNLFMKVVKHGDIQSIGVTLTLFVLARIVIQKALFREWFFITFKTLQLFLAQGQTLNRNAVEAAWSNILRGFSLFGITAISAIICKIMINVQHSEIDTIEDLIASNLSVAVPDTLQHQFDVFASTLHPDLRKRIVIEKMQELDNAIMMEGDFSKAYVYQEAIAQFLLKLTEFFSRGAVGDVVRIRIMKENLYCKLTSYRITRTSPYKRIVNSFIKTFIESGLYRKQLEWHNRLNDAIFESYRDKISKKIRIALKLDTVYEIFLLYLIGTTIGFVIFIGEIMFKFVQMKKI